MTITTDAVRTDWMITNGVQKDWPYSITIFQASHVIVRVRDAEGDIVEYTTNFSFLPTDSSSGFIRYPATGDALAAGYHVQIVREVPYRQPMALGAQGAFNPELHERAIDMLALQIQQSKEIIDRTWQKPLDMTTPIEEERLLKIDAQGTVLPGPTTFEIAATASDSAASAAAAQAAKLAAQAARAGAEAAEINAADAQAAAEAALAAALLAQTGAETAETNAVGAVSAAEAFSIEATASKNAAAASAIAAAASATNADTSADEAADSADAAAASAAAAAGAVSSAIGVTVQAQSSKLDNIAALTETDGGFIVGDGAAWTVESGATARASLGLGSAALKDVGTTGDVLVAADALNEFTALQTFSTPNTGTAVLRAVSTNDSSAQGPAIDLYRNSPSPAADDSLGYFRLRGNNTVGTEVSYSLFRGRIIDATAGMATGGFEIYTLVGNSLTAQLTASAGIILGAPVGGYKGVGTLNATGYYLNGEQLLPGLFGLVPTFVNGAVIGDNIADPVTIKGTLVNSYTAGLFALDSAAAWKTALGVASTFTHRAGGWVTATNYAVGDWLTHNDTPYIAIVAHTSGATNQPGVGASWETYWEANPFGTLSISNVTNAQLANMPEATFKGRQPGAGAGSPQDMTASQVRTALGLVVGTNVQAYEAGLQAIAGLSKATGNIIIGNGASWEVQNGAAARLALGLGIGTQVQAHDADLTAIAGLTSAPNKIPYYTGSGTAALADFTAAGRAVAGAADAAAQRTALALGAAATAGFLDEDNFASNSASAAPSQQSTKAYVDSQRVMRPTRADAIANFHPTTAPDIIVTGGYAAPGDLGGAYYKKVVAEPAHLGKFSITEAGGAVVWYELYEMVVRPEMFGASRSKAVLSTSALQAMAGYVNLTNAVIALTAIYRSAAPLDFTCSGLVIQGTTSRLSGFVFDSADGIRLDQSALSSFVRYDITNICVLAKSENLYKGFKYTGQASSGGGHTMRRIEGCHFAGEGFFDFSGEVISESMAVRNSAWHTSLDLQDSDNTHVTNCRIHGSWQQWMNNNSVSNPKFGAEAVAIRAHNTTALFIQETQIQYVCWGVLGSGQSEGIVFEHGGITACGYGITVRDTAGAANNCKCIDSHLSCYWGCVDYGTIGSGAYMMHFIKGNLMFLFPGTSADNVLDGEPFRFVKGNMLRSHIIDNHFYVVPGDNAAALGVIAIELTGSSCLINGNIFQGCADIIKINVGSSQNVISMNYTTASEAGYAVSDGGTGTVCLNNYGDKIWPAAGGNIVIPTSGQSNMAREDLLAGSGTWVPPRNLRVWNGTPTSVGTAWIVPNTGRMNPGWAYAAEVARRNPDANVYVVNISRAGTGILEWTPGFAIIDMVAAIDANMVAALATLTGPTRITDFLFWQAENDAGAPSSWPANFELMVASLKAKTWWHDALHMTIFGITGSANSNDVRHDAMNVTIQGVVAKDPARRSYVPTGTLPAAFWEDTLHATAEGYMQLGVMAYNVAHGGGEGPKLNGGFVTLADDKAVAIAPPFARGTVEFIGTSIVENASFDFDTVSALRGRDSAGTEANLATGALADAGGTDGKMTYSVGNTGLIYASNRRGASRTVYVTFKGG